MEIDREQALVVVAELEAGASAKVSA